ncbi:MAG TPA: Holliday junction resolvase RuvX [Solirubrobacterales bacterium]|nr:Holliday junction resolvase RuvX [Solirubrobacterales bacterium]
MRTLALDHGLARIGCAVCDPSGTVVSPIEVIEPPDAEAAAELVAAREVELVVVGLPRGLSGREGEQAEHARAFAAELAGLLGDRAPVETYDERLTTLMARQSRLAGAGAAEDSLAAAHLLESFLASRAAAGVSGDA